ncbi:MAG: hypothetical protein QXQ94_11950 [Candidatus Bathyarchaeia archaeon]
MKEEKVEMCAGKITRKAIFGLVLFMLLSTSMFPLSILSGGVVGYSSLEEGSDTIIYDDFSVDSGMWEYLGNAYRDPVNQCLVLTEPTTWQAGVAFFNITFTTSFIANFSFKVGGGSGADGFVMFFYKQNYSYAYGGGYLGFSDNPYGHPGYGIEFDTFLNGPFNDPSDNHIALIQNNVDTHLIHANDTRVKDNAWHNVSVEVEDSSVKVYMDEDLIFQWNGDLNRTYNYFGFCGATGSYTNWHIIDNFSIKIPHYNLTISANYGGTTNPAPGTYTYVSGTSFEVVAVPEMGYSFDHWLLDGEVKTENPITLVMNTNHTLEAYFVDDIPPEISEPVQQPPQSEVQADQEVRVWVNVTDFGTSIKNVTLWYSLNNGTDWTILNMTAYREIYEALWGVTIPGYGNCTWVTYKIVAYDNAENMAVENNNGYYYQYHVIPEFPLTALTLVILTLTTLIATIILRTKRKQQFN